MNDEFSKERYETFENPTAAYPRTQILGMLEATDEVEVEPSSDKAMSVFYLMVALFGGSMLALGLVGLVVVLFYVA